MWLVDRLARTPLLAIDHRPQYQCCGSGIRCLFDPGPGSGIDFFPDPGSRIPDLRSRIPNPYFLELSDKFLCKKFYNSLKTGPNFLQHLKKKIIFNFVKFVATKKGLITNFFTPLFCCCFWIRDPEWVKIRIRDKHPGSATLLSTVSRYLRLPVANFQRKSWPVFFCDCP